MKSIPHRSSAGAFSESVPSATLAHLYAPVPQTLLMIAALNIIAFLVFQQRPETADRALLAAAAIAGIARIIVLLLGRRRLGRGSLDALAISRLRRDHAVAYLAFALVLGLFALRNILADIAPVHLIVLCLIVSYAAGVALLVGLRPWLAASAMTIAVLPTGLALLFHPDPFYRLTGLTMIAMLAGGVHSVMNHAGSVAKEMSGRLASQMLAWRDPLTGLWNRRALDDWFAKQLATDSGMLYAVHSIDLDGFKQVNDAYGHQAGDDVLCAVAGRLTRAVRSEDFVVRMGGDEFVVIQPGIVTDEDARQLAGRISEMVTGAYAVGPARARIGLSIGSIVARIGIRPLADLLREADRVLYSSRDRVRRPRRGEPDWSPAPSPESGATGPTREPSPTT
ncbi:GGDEF domain-containing protein [Sphingomonas sp. ZT3P38]|uniref:GGDEF domain-containing protein n=1 Tax=Parasphingomonas zepuensis TaxID=3096161 RepID=UPI002FCA8F51